ncbi:COB(I) alamin adenosyltransferase [Salmonella enterica subsp. arizonae]|uniref:corrinoid adenosyltransferase n=1 Tax=Salmonella enterica subsp. arizonae TaxID=59203 RepID=A0A379S275_SALER|nr:COB(I) alamin adenosyltransferase [Salmonella enterica subsp. arizonae]
MSALNARPSHQTVIINRSWLSSGYLDLADTVSELRPVKHAFDAGVKARWELIINVGRDKAFAPSSGINSLI